MSDVETVEQALEAVADIIDSEQFCDYVRKGLESGHELNYKLTIKLKPQGVVVAFVAEKNLPTRPLKTFLRLQ